MIVELFGLPGAGKTYVINAIKGNGTIGVESTFLIKRFIVSILKRVSLITPESKKLKKRILSVLKTDSLSPLYTSTSVVKHVDNIILVMFGYSHSAGRTLFLDEGIIHRIVTFAVNYNLESDTVLKILDIVIPYLSSINVFYLDCDVQDCLSSIKTRNRHFCEMDELNELELHNFLLSYKFYFELVQDKYHFPTITRNSIFELEKIIK